MGFSMPKHTYLYLSNLVWGRLKCSKSQANLVRFQRAKPKAAISVRSRRDGSRFERNRLVWVASIRLFALARGFFFWYRKSRQLILIVCNTFLGSTRPLYLQRHLLPVCQRVVVFPIPWLLLLPLLLWWCTGC